MPDPKDSLFTGLPSDLPKPEEQPKTASSLPEELQGKSVDEVYSKLREEHERVLREREAELAQKPQAPVYQQQPPVQQAPVIPQQPQPELEYYQDPGRFLEEQLNKRVAPLVDAQVQNNKQVAREVFRNSLPPGEWDRYQGEIEQFVSQVAPQALASNALGVYNAAITFIRGNHIEEIVKERSSSEAKRILKEVMAETGGDEAGFNRFFEPSQPQPRTSLFQSPTGTIPKTAPARPAASAGNAPAKTKLSDEEHKVAVHFGMSDAEYATWGGK
jgi:hypothetical protein